MYVRTILAVAVLPLFAQCAPTPSTPPSVPVPTVVPRTLPTYEMPTVPTTVATLPVCVAVGGVVTAYGNTPLGCDLVPPMVLNVWVETVAQCNDMGGRVAWVMPGSTLCAKVDY